MAVTACLDMKFLSKCWGMRAKSGAVNGLAAKCDGEPMMDIHFIYECVPESIGFSVNIDFPEWPELRMK
jgi:hypothetical protein